MTVNSISAASLSQYVPASSGTSQLQQALQNLESSITSGDLNGAQSAFEVLQSLNQSLTAESGSNSVNDSQLSNDLTSLGSALSSGNLSAAQSAFTTVQSDLRSSSAPSQQNEINAAFSIRATGAGTAHPAECEQHFFQHLRFQHFRRNHLCVTEGLRNVERPQRAGLMPAVLASHTRQRQTVPLSNVPLPNYY